MPPYGLSSALAIGEASYVREAGYETVVITMAIAMAIATAIAVVETTEV
jgi:hypothetical protein